MFQILCEGGCGGPKTPLFYDILHKLFLISEWGVTTLLLILSIVSFVKWICEKKRNKEKKTKLLNRSKKYFLFSIATFWIPVILSLSLTWKRMETIGQAINRIGMTLGAIFLIGTGYLFAKWLLELLFNKGNNNSLKKAGKILLVAILTVLICYLVGQGIDYFFPNELYPEGDGQWVTCWC